LSDVHSKFCCFLIELTEEKRKDVEPIEKQSESELQVTDPSLVMSLIQYLRVKKKKEQCLSMGI